MSARMPNVSIHGVRLCETCAEKVGLSKRAKAARIKARIPTASGNHHAKFRREQEIAEEEVSAATWCAVLIRTREDHRGRYACEGCHSSADYQDDRGLEPHHLEMGASGRRDAPEVVMALCSSCHRMGTRSAHGTPHLFAQSVVIPWLEAHGYPRPARKEYR